VGDGAVSSVASHTPGLFLVLNVGPTPKGPRTSETVPSVEQTERMRDPLISSVGLGWVGRLARGGGSAVVGVCFRNVLVRAYLVGRRVREDLRRLSYLARPTVLGFAVGNTTYPSIFPVDSIHSYPRTFVPWFMIGNHCLVSYPCAV
jgi:hypothetical protein